MDRIRKAVREYKIRGAAGIKESFEAAIGAIDLRRNEIKKAGRRASNKEILGKAFTWLQNVNLVLSIAIHGKTLLPAAIERAIPLLKASEAALSQ